MWCHRQNMETQGPCVSHKIFINAFFQFLIFWPFALLMQQTKTENLVHAHQRIITVKLHQIGPSSLGEVVWSLSYITPCKLDWTNFWLQGHNLNNFDRGPLHESCCYISNMKALGFVFFWLEDYWNSFLTPFFWHCDLLIQQTEIIRTASERTS